MEERRSYAIPTVTKPGAKRSLSIADIRKNILKFYEFAKNHSSYKFFVAQTAKNGYCGYSPEELARAYSCDSIPDNVFFHHEFAEILKKVLHDFQKTA